MLTTKIDTTFHETPKRYRNAAAVTYESLNKTNWIQFLCRSVYRRLNVQGYWVLRGDGWNLRWGGGGGKEGLEMREFFNLQLISAPESLNPDRQIDWRWGVGGGGRKPDAWPAGMEESPLGHGRGLGVGTVSLLKHTSFTQRQFTLLSFGLRTKTCWKIRTENVTNIHFLI